MNQVATIPAPRQSLIASMAAQYHMEPKAFADTIRATCLPGTASNEEFAAFLMVAKEYGLNPITREIYAFPKKGGGIQPIVGIDGWLNLINSHPQCDGIEFDDVKDAKGALTAITCRIFRRDRGRPTMVTEYMDECKRPTEPWQKWPARMLRHKAAIQCARYAFGFAGIIDPEEAERSPEVITSTVVAPPPPVLKRDDAISPIPDNGFDKDMEGDAADIVTETGEATDAITDGEVFDAAEFFAELETAMAGAMDEATVEEVWTTLDPQGTFDGDDLNLDIAYKIRNRRLAQLSPLGA